MNWDNLLDSINSQIRLDSSGLDNLLNNFNRRGGSSDDIESIISLIINSILNPVVALIIGLAVVYFMWGVIKYVNRGHEDVGEAVKMMTYGIVAIFVMVSVWGLVHLLINTFDLTNTPVPQPEL